MAKSLKADENEPSTTHNCESSRAPKKKYHTPQATSDQRTQNCKKQSARRNTVQFPSETTARKQLKILLCTLLHSAWLADPTRRAGQRRPQDPSTPSRRKKSSTTNAPRAAAEQATAVEPGIAQKSTMQQTCHCITQVHRQLSMYCNPRATKLSLHNNGPTKNLYKNWNCSNTTASMN